MRSNCCCTNRGSVPLSSWMTRCAVCAPCTRSTCIAGSMRPQRVRLHILHLLERGGYRYFFLFFFFLTFFLNFAQSKVLRLKTKFTLTEVPACSAWRSLILTRSWHRSRRRDALASGPANCSAAVLGSAGRDPAPWSCASDSDGCIVYGDIADAPWSSSLRWLEGRRRRIS